MNNTNDPLKVTVDFIEKWRALANEALDAMEELSAMREKYINDWDQSNVGLKENHGFMKSWNNRCQACNYPEILHNENGLCKLSLEEAIEIIKEAEDVTNKIYGIMRLVRSNE